MFCQSILVACLNAAFLPLRPTQILLSLSFHSIKRRGLCPLDESIVGLSSSWIDLPIQSSRRSIIIGTSPFPSRRASQHVSIRERCDRRARRPQQWLSSCRKFVVFSYAVLLSFLVSQIQCIPPSSFVLNLLPRARMPIHRHHTIRAETCRIRSALF